MIIFRQPSGTVFPLTEREAFRLNALIRQEFGTEAAPSRPGPDQSSDPPSAEDLGRLPSYYRLAYALRITELLFALPSSSRREPGSSASLVAAGWTLATESGPTARREAIRALERIRKDQRSMDDRSLEILAECISLRLEPRLRRTTNQRVTELCHAVSANYMLSPIRGEEQSPIQERDKVGILGDIYDHLYDHALQQNANDDSPLEPNVRELLDETGLGQGCQRVRRLVRDGRYVEARRCYLETARLYPRSVGGLRAELRFVIHEEVDERADRRNWDNERPTLEWRRRAWAALCHLWDDEPPSAVGASPAPADSPKAESAWAGPAASPEPVKRRGTKTKPRATKLSSERKGELLEKAAKDLLRLLFRNEEPVVLDFLAQQPRGMQFGFDIKISYSWLKNNVQTRCLVECKSQESTITLKDIADKLASVSSSSSTLDHWILLAPRASLSGELNRLVDQWEDQQTYPFKVQLWTRDTQVQQLFGLAPEHYADWFDHPAGEEHPAEWSRETRDKILEHWRRKLDPPLRLPKGWRNYVTDRESLRISGDLLLPQLEKVGTRYIELRGIDRVGSPLAESMTETATKWLASDTPVLLLLGDFGDGKTVFHYFFSRHLLESFRKDPKTGWLPLRLALRDFSRLGIGNGRDILRYRLEDFGADINSWRELRSSHRVLVILDGLDEISKSSNRRSVGHSLGLLLDCWEEEFQDVKVLVTCRTPFFKNLPEGDAILEKLKDPLMVYLRPFDRVEVDKGLARQAQTPEQQRKLWALRRMHDPLGLGTKPLYFEMLSNTLDEPGREVTNEVELYEQYIQKSLERKYELLAQQDTVPSKSLLVPNMLSILEHVALDIQGGNREYARLRKLFRKGQKADFARMLWNATGSPDSDQEDALQRVGVRSLLQRVEIGDEEFQADEWPVDFCHRSIREFLVARRLGGVIPESVAKTREILTKLDLNHEIIHFLTVMIKEKGTRDYTAALRQLAVDSRETDGDGSLSRDERARLGRNAVTVLYKSHGELQEQDWTRMLLDGVDLAGADLAGKNFTGSSLRNANLDNADLTESVFANADLTGVQLEETAEVRAIDVAGGGDGFVAAYSDGSLRWWDLRPSSGSRSYVTYRVPKKASQRVEMAVQPGVCLCLANAGEIDFADRTTAGHELVSRFRSDGRAARVVFKADRILVVEEPEPAKHRARLFDLREERCASGRVVDLGQRLLCDCLGWEAVVVAEPERGFVVLPFERQDQPPVRADEVEKVTALAARVPVHLEPEAYAFACGEQSGFVSLWHYRPAREDQPLEMICRQKVHTRAVTALAFVDDHSLLSGGQDRLLCQLAFGHERGAFTLGRAFALKLRCRGMRIDGLKSDKEREALVKFISNDQHENAVQVE